MVVANNANKSRDLSMNGSRIIEKEREICGMHGEMVKPVDRMLKAE